ncbi:MAG: alpha/beta hydrolase [Bernardetiaceae bacterium]|jgi:hypothetical protein|nr:alpha/beta hydrolase [Bernardetiaceae bacterium]
MPISPPAPYRPPFYYFGNAHLQTVVPSLFRQVRGPAYVRERLPTPDGDFLDLDWAKRGSNRLLIVTHGLEGSADRHYVKGLIAALHPHGWDGLGWNCRSCSGELNRLPRFYHHGDTPDLALVVDHALAQGYQTVVLAGFSLGGSLTLKYLGERGAAVPAQVKKGLAVSVPCRLAECGAELSKPSKMFYTRRFLKKLNAKIRAKAAQMPHHLSLEPLASIRIFEDFDNAYTAPLHGFASAHDYYERASSIHYLAGVRVPTLLISALNDPFLTPGCFPVEVAQAHPYLHLEMPAQGGHVGFEQAGSPRTYVEDRLVRWVADLGA